MKGYKFPEIQMKVNNTEESETPEEWDREGGKSPQIPPFTQVLNTFVPKMYVLEITTDREMR